MNMDLAAALERRLERFIVQVASTARITRNRRMPHKILQDIRLQIFA